MYLIYYNLPKPTRPETEFTITVKRLFYIIYILYILECVQTLINYLRILFPSHRYIYTTNQGPDP